MCVVLKIRIALGEGSTSVVTAYNVGIGISLTTRIYNGLCLCKG